MKFKIVNFITGREVDPLAMIRDMIERDKLFRLPLLFDDEFHDLKIVPREEPPEARTTTEAALTATRRPGSPPQSECRPTAQERDNQ